MSEENVDAPPLTSVELLDAAVWREIDSTQIAELNPQRASSSRDFLCRIWFLCWNLTKKH
jgi:hypothetical protein